MTTPALALAGATRRNGFILEVALTMAVGETIAILGPNGAGKTTLLRLVAGLERLESGSLRLAGRTVDDGVSVAAPHRRPIGWVPQDRLVFDHLTVAANVGFSPRATPERTAALTDALDLTGLVDRPVGECSGGQAQRVAVARALAADPTVLLLDEPTTGLHLADVEALMTLLQRLGDLGNTVVVVEHHLDVVKLADHVIDLGPEGGDRGGEIMAEGAPEQVMEVKGSYTRQLLQKYIPN